MKKWELDRKARWARQDRRMFKQAVREAYNGRRNTVVELDHSSNRTSWDLGLPDLGEKAE